MEQQKQTKTIEIKFKTDLNGNIITMKHKVDSFVDAIQKTEENFTITEIKSIKYV